MTLSATEHDLPLGLLDPPETPHRAHIAFDEVARLADDIAARGLLQRIGVRALGDSGRYEVVFGHRRYLAMKQLRWPTVPCRVFPAGVDVEAVRAAENLFRVDLSAIEEAHICAVLARLGRTVPEIARELRHSVEWVDGRLAMLQWPEDIRAAVSERGLALAVARELATIDHDATRRGYVEEAIANGATARVVQVWTAQYHADRERIISNRMTVEEMIERREAFEVRASCAWCTESHPLEKTSTVRLCFGCLSDFEQARALAVQPEAGRD